MKQIMFNTLYPRVCKRCGLFVYILPWDEYCYDCKIEIQEEENQKD